MLTVRRVLTRPDVDQAIRVLAAHDFERMQRSPWARECRYEVLLPTFQCEGRDPLLGRRLRAVRQLPDVQRLRRVETVNIEHGQLVESEWLVPLDAVPISRELDDERTLLHPEVERADLRDRVDLSTSYAIRMCVSGRMRGSGCAEHAR